MVWFLAGLMGRKSAWLADSTVRRAAVFLVRFIGSSYWCSGADKCIYTYIHPRYMCVLSLFGIEQDTKSDEKCKAKKKK